MMWNGNTTEVYARDPAILDGTLRVRIVHGPTVVATHRRSREPFARIVDAAHFVGLWRPAAAPDAVAPTLTALGRQLADYVAVVAGGAQ